MFSEQVELRGHIIDSLILPKVLDEILSHGGNFRVLEVSIGKPDTAPSHVRVEISGPSTEVVHDIVGRLRHISEKEGIDVDDHALKLIARSATGMPQAMRLRSTTVESSSTCVTG